VVVRPLFAAFNKSLFRFFVQAGETITSENKQIINCLKKSILPGMKKAICKHDYNFIQANLTIKIFSGLV
jgi:hypothetical protein